MKEIWRFSNLSGTIYRHCLFFFIPKSCKFSLLGRAKKERDRIGPWKWAVRTGMSARCQKTCLNVFFLLNSPIPVLLFSLSHDLFPTVDPRFSLWPIYGGDDLFLSFFFVVPMLFLSRTCVLWPKYLQSSQKERKIRFYIRIPDIGFSPFLPVWSCLVAW